MKSENGSKPYRDERTLRDLYIRRNYTKRDIACHFEINIKTARRWLNRYDITKPWRDWATLQQMYADDGLTCEQIAERFNCSLNTIAKWLRRHDIETDDAAELIHRATDELRTNYASFYTERRGYERWDSGNDGDDLYVHRLLAVAEYGFEAVGAKQVHHKNGIPWDNRPENIEPLHNSDHQTIHGRSNLWAGEGES